MEKGNRLIIIFCFHVQPSCMVRAHVIFASMTNFVRQFTLVVSHHATKSEKFTSQGKLDDLQHTERMLGRCNVNAPSCGQMPPAAAADVPDDSVTLCSYNQESSQLGGPRNAWFYLNVSH